MTSWGRLAQRLANERVQQAIAESVEFSTVVRLESTPERVAELRTLSDDSVRCNDEHEFWGTDADGHHWRVHLFEREAHT